MNNQKLITFSNVTISKKADRSAKTMPRAVQNKLKATAIAKSFRTYTTSFLALLETRR